MNHSRELDHIKQKHDQLESACVKLEFAAKWPTGRCSLKKWSGPWNKTWLWPKRVQPGRTGSATHVGFTTFHQRPFMRSWRTPQSWVFPGRNHWSGRCHKLELWPRSRRPICEESVAFAFCKSFASVCTRFERCVHSWPSECSARRCELHREEPAQREALPLFADRGKSFVAVSFTRRSWFASKVFHFSARCFSWHTSDAQTAMKEGIYLDVLLWSWEATMLKEIEKTREQSQRRKKEREERN